ncbi:hypothetical protein B0H19DRAFT_1264632 [Mycena capillaripes]|nr:hypothetical protein B0H19DRAFT_1264632 [Mycena capillaripes]
MRIGLKLQCAHGPSLRCYAPTSPCLYHITIPTRCTTRLDAAATPTSYVPAYPATGIFARPTTAAHYAPTLRASVMGGRNGLEIRDRSPGVVVPKLSSQTVGARKGIGDTAANGGKGEGPELFVPLVETEIVNGIEFPTDISTMTVVAFCEEYHLGEDIYGLLTDHSFRKACDILFHKDLSQEELGFKVGHIAELKWALAYMLLKSELVSGVEIIEKGGSHPILIGGQGGAGGHGGKRGGDGGTGKANRIALDQAIRFKSITGGTGGPGGPGATIGTNGTGDLAEPTIGKRQRVNSTSGVPRGGTEEDGAPGTQVGGSGGDGMGARLPIEALGRFKLIQGGTGGQGGAGEVQGGTGGTGYATDFPEPLCPIDTKTRLKVKNLGLDKKDDLKAKNFEIDDELQRLLVEHGFMTVGGLFHVFDSDLRKIEDTCGKKLFKAGDIAALKRALRGFLRSLP